MVITPGVFGEFWHILEDLVDLIPTPGVEVVGIHADIKASIETGQIPMAMPMEMEGSFALTRPTPHGVVEEMAADGAMSDTLGFPYPLAVLGILGVTELVVVSNDKMDGFGVEAREELVQIIRRPCEVSEVVEDISPSEDRVESLEHYLLHLEVIRERALAVLDDPVVAKMGICGEPTLWGHKRLVTSRLARPGRSPNAGESIEGALVRADLTSWPFILQVLRHIHGCPKEVPGFAPGLGAKEYPYQRRSLLLMGYGCPRCLRSRRTGREYNRPTTWEDDETTLIKLSSTPLGWHRGTLGTGRWRWRRWPTRCRIFHTWIRGERGSVIGILGHKTQSHN